MTTQVRKALSREPPASAGIGTKPVLLVSKPHMERRSFATARKLWREADLLCASESMEVDGARRATTPAASYWCGRGDPGT
ncbi:hypothetical protein [Streptomyces sp. NPDC058548]|uniref:hypothetical protein n=1 Tax=Streptomyces sp. NPDC058548 TaxID=3346545 RepID=UPI0036476D23